MWRDRRAIHFAALQNEIELYPNQNLECVFFIVFIK